MNHTPTFNSECETVREVEPANYVREVTARYIGPRRKSVVISSAEMAAQFMRRLLKDHAREHFIALYLSGSHRVVSHSLVSLGTANSASLHPREVFQAAILAGACSIIVGHNHPSGDLNESSADTNITERLKKVADLLGIPLLDHIIFSPEAFLSMRDQRRFAFD